MAISTLMDLVVRGAEADGAVVVALFRGARRHFCAALRGTVQLSLALLSTGVDRRRPRTQVLFRATESVQLSGRVVSRRQRLAVE